MAEPQHRARIRACWSFIVSHLRAQDIADYLFEHSVLSSEHVQCVTYEGITDEERTRRLLRILLSRDDRAFNVFIESLAENYDFLAEEMLQKELPETDIDDDSSDDEDCSGSNNDKASQHCDAYILCSEADYDKVMKFKDKLANDIIFGDGSRAKVYMRGDLYWTNSVYGELDEVLNKKYNIFVWNSPAFRKEARAQAFLEEFMCALTHKEDKRQRVLVLRTVQGDKKHPIAAKAAQSVNVFDTVMSMMDLVDVPDSGFIVGGPSLADLDAHAFGIIRNRILHTRRTTQTGESNADNTEDESLYSESASFMPIAESSQPLNQHPPPFTHLSSSTENRTDGAAGIREVNIPAYSNNNDILTASISPSSSEQTFTKIAPREENRNYLGVTRTTVNYTVPENGQVLGGSLPSSRLVTQNSPYDGTDGTNVETKNQNDMRNIQDSSNVSSLSANSSNNQGISSLSLDDETKELLL